jgi:hypothetical protein
MKYPNGAEFAFTILDDTDDSRYANAAPFYALLRDLGLRTTKTVWPVTVPRDQQGPFFAGATLDDPEYAGWVRQLVAEGFEIASHNASMGSSEREQTVRGLKVTEGVTGFRPRLHCNHAQNRENIYWGSARFQSALLGPCARLFERFGGRRPYLGHVPGTAYFWGDIALQHFEYVRSFAFSTLATDGLGVPCVYHDNATKWVKRWFITADAPDADAFRALVTRQSIDALRKRAGHVIVSTHIGKGFVDSKGRVDPAIANSLQYLASHNGWFVPTSTLLDWIVQQQGAPTLTALQRLRLESTHVIDRIRSRLFSKS